MRVVDHEPHTWFLLKEGDRNYLDAQVNRSAVSWSVLIELNEQERREYQAIGRSYLDSLAALINSSTENYSARDLTQSKDRDVLEAVRTWRFAGQASGSDTSYFAYDRMGCAITTPDEIAMFELLHSLAAADPEHPSVSLTHESGWCGTVFGSGLVVLENVESGDGPWHMLLASPKLAIELWRLLARGLIESVQAHPWVPGYGA